MAIWKKKTLTASGILLICLMGANFLNFGFNAFLGRVLSTEQFGLVTFLNTIVYLLNILLAAVGATVIHNLAFANASHGPKHATLLYRRLERKLIRYAIIGTTVFIVISPLLTRLFHIHTVTVLLYLSPVIFAAIIAALGRAYLQGRLFLDYVGLLILLDPLFKLLFSFIIVYSGRPELAYVSLPLASLCAALCIVAFVSRISNSYRFSSEDLKGPSHFPIPFFIAALTTGLANNLFISIDILLVKHYFSPLNAGIYALLSLVGKMIYFFGSLFNSLLLPLVSSDLGSKRNPTTTFYTILSGTVFFVVFCVLGMVFLGEIMLPLAFGEKVATIFPYIPYYSIAIGAYTISSTILTYHLARKHFIFSFVAFFIALLLCLGIALFNENITQVVHVMLVLSLANLFSMLLLHIIHQDGVALIRNIIDFLCLFLPLPHSSSSAPGKRILLFNWRDTKHAFGGGAEVYIHELSKRWVANGCQVTLFCGNDTKCSRYEEVDGVEIIRRGGFFTVYIWGFLYYLFRLRKRYDVIIDSQNGIPFFTPLFASEKVYCLLFHVHQKVFLESLPLPLALLARYLEGNITPWAYRNVEFITISESTKKEMQELGIGKAGIHIVHPGVDTSRMVPGEKHKKPLVLYVGRLKKYKSVHLFLKAIPLIKKKVPDATFVIAGDGEERKRLTLLTEKLGIADVVTFTGKVSESKKLELYQKAWVFVNPSSMEGWAITNIEANACGTPVVAADVPGMRDSVRDGVSGFLVEYGNVNKLADSVCKLILEADTRESISMKAYRWAKRFNWDVGANKSLEIIRGEK
ncbi:MAG: glycosyltransferase [Patescibacteria group bacterium]|nr:glycosyltransferase [Patescibacteria group bacterium]